MQRMSPEHGFNYNLCGPHVNLELRLQLSGTHMVFGQESKDFVVDSRYTVVMVKHVTKNQ